MTKNEKVKFTQEDFNMLEATVTQCQKKIEQLKKQNKKLKQGCSEIEAVSFKHFCDDVAVRRDSNRTTDELLKLIDEYKLKDALKEYNALKCLFYDTHKLQFNYDKHEYGVKPDDQ